MQNPLARKVVLSLACLIAAGCQRTPPATKPKDEAPASTFTVASLQPLERHVEQPAVIEAYKETPLVAGIPGFVDKIAMCARPGGRSEELDIGDAVEAGQVLVTLRVPERVAELAQKKELV